MKPLVRSAGHGIICFGSSLLWAEKCRQKTHKIFVRWKKGWKYRLEASHKKQKGNLKCHVTNTAMQKFHPISGYKTRAGHTTTEAPPLLINQKDEPLATSGRFYPYIPLQCFDKHQKCRDSSLYLEIGVHIRTENGKKSETWFESKDEIWPYDSEFSQSWLGLVKVEKLA